MKSNGAEPLRFEIRPARDSDVPVLASLFRELDYSRLHGLGPTFAQVLFRHIVHSPHSMCLVAAANDEIHGFLADALNAKKFSRSFVLRRGFPATLAVLGRLLQPQNARTVLHCLTFFSGEQPFGDQEASGLAFAIREESKRHGIGKALWEARNVEFRRLGITAFTFMTNGEPTAAANAFYEKLGCEFLGVRPFYKDTVASLYRCNLDEEGD